MFTVVAVYGFAVAVFVNVLFQIALALGAPWGELAMGGRFPGKFSPAMRVLAVVQASVLALLAVVVAIRGGLVLPEYFDASVTVIWIVVGVSALSLVMNLVTPSKRERILWAPVAFVMLVSSLVVALS